MHFIHSFHIAVDTDTGFGDTTAAAAVGTVLLNLINEFSGIDLAFRFHRAGFAVRDNVGTGHVDIITALHIQLTLGMDARLFVGFSLIMIFRTTTGINTESRDRDTKPGVAGERHACRETGMPAGRVGVYRILA